MMYTPGRTELSDNVSYETGGFRFEEIYHESRTQLDYEDDAFEVESVEVITKETQTQFNPFLSWLGKGLFFLKN